MNTIDRPPQDSESNKFFSGSSWVNKFRFAFRGVAVGVRDGNSFWIHLPCAIVVLGLATWCRCTWLEFAVLGICIGLVLMAELFNSAIECLARAITRDQNDQIRDALDIASGAVLVVSGMAALIGLAILLPAVLRAFFGMG
jgi:diacylglycerol kinase (ATP)